MTALHFDRVELERIGPRLLLVAEGVEKRRSYDSTRRRAAAQQRRSRICRPLPSCSSPRATRAPPSPRSPSGPTSPRTWCSCSSPANAAFSRRSWTSPSAETTRTSPCSNEKGRRLSRPRPTSGTTAAVRRRHHQPAGPGPPFNDLVRSAAAVEPEIPPSRTTCTCASAASRCAWSPPGLPRTGRCATR